MGTLFKVFKSHYEETFFPLKSNLSDYEITGINPIIYFQPRTSLLLQTVPCNAY